ncbi:hypothetical protein [Shewanella surugensis]|uniref:Lipoprotein n=1 Tax=Shewanella surugensis TaxID=212020 RepID=A0ABT0LA49_9GAMM|nr:hypothetical protein [Shewanella surugensis]MCL1124434.1 hypothetical protein [Shewanella surugensis]
MSIVMLTLSFFTLTACTSSGVVPIGESIFIVSKKSAACGFSSGEGTKVDLYREANAYCEEKHKSLVTVEAITRDGVPFVRCASVELTFKYITSNKS